MFPIDRLAQGTLHVPVLALVGRRAMHNIHLVLVTLVGLVAAAALISSIPLYTEALSTAGLRRELTQVSSDRTMPRASLLLNYVSARGAVPLSRDQYRAADEFVGRAAPAAMGLPAVLSVRYAQTDLLPILVSDGVQLSARESVGSVFLAYLQDLEAHADMLEGRWPYPGRASDGALEAAISTDALDELGLEVGQRVTLLAQQSGSYVQIPVRLVGRWYPRASTDAYWFNRVDYYKDALFTGESGFFDDLLGLFPRAAREYDWYYVLDPSGVRAGDADAMLKGIAGLRAGAQQVLRSLKLDVSPEDLLETYRQKLFFLRVLLFVLSAPLLAIVLHFTTVVSGLLVERQRNEIAVLKSRGASTRQVLWIYLVEGLVLGAIAVGVGPLLGGLLALAIGRSDSFLGFSGGSLLPVRLETSSYLYSALAVVLALAASLLPALGAAAHSIVTYKQETARMLRPPLWRRYFLDLLPVPAAAYAYYLLTERRTVLPTGQAGDVFSDPLLLLAPTLFIFAAALVFLRIFPVLVALVERLGRWVVGVSLLVALRHIARQPYRYVGLVLLLALTLAIGTFSAAVARTLDRNYEDAAAYRVGADLRLAEGGAYDAESGEWSFFPLDDHLSVPGVLAASRVLSGAGKEKLGSRNRDIQVLGIDTETVGDTLYWRADYADRPLSDLLALLDQEESGALVNRGFLNAYHLRVGDQVSLSVKDQQVDFLIVGAVDYFPTLYPDAGHFVVTRVDYLFSQLPAWPYDVWTKLAPGTDPAAVVADLQTGEVPVTRFESLTQTLWNQRQDVTRLGVFGLLSVGFLMSAFLCMLGLLFYSYHSFRRRLQQLGVLRAIGLSVRQLVGVYLWEQALLVVAGVSAGTVLGVAAADIFIPFLQIKAEAHAGIPPFVVPAPWSGVLHLYAILAIFLLLAFLVALFLLTRMPIHEAIKFGEEQA